MNLLVKYQFDPTFKLKIMLVSVKLYIKRKKKGLKLPLIAQPFYGPH